MQFYSSDNNIPSSLAVCSVRLHTLLAAFCFCVVFFLVVLALCFCFVLPLCALTLCFCFLVILHFVLLTCVVPVCLAACSVAMFPALCILFYVFALCLCFVSLCYVFAFVSFLRVFALCFCFVLLHFVLLTCVVCLQTMQVPGLPAYNSAVFKAPVPASSTSF